MPKKLTDTAKRAFGAGSKPVGMGGKSSGPTKLSNTASRSTAKGSPKSPADFGKLGMNTLKANKAKTGGKRKGY